MTKSFNGRRPTGKPHGGKRGGAGGGERPRFGKGGEDKRPDGDKRGRAPRSEGDRADRGERPARGERSGFAGKRPPREGGDRPWRERSEKREDRGPRDGGGERRERFAKSGDGPPRGERSGFAGKRPPREGGDRPWRERSEKREDRGPGEGGGERRERFSDRGDRPARGERSGFAGKRPPREGGDRPWRERGEKREDRGPRDGGGERRERFSDRGDRPARGERSGFAGKRPPREGGDRPWRERSEKREDRGPRDGGGERRERFSDRGDRPARGERSGFAGKRPPREGGDRPWRERSEKREDRGPGEGGGERRERFSDRGDRPARGERSGFAGKRPPREGGDRPWRERSEKREDRGPGEGGGERRERFAKAGDGPDGRPRTKPPRSDRAAHDRVPRGAEMAAVSEPMRIAKAISRAGLCSRRDAERWIEEGRVSVNGEVLKTPAHTVGPADKVLVDGRPLPAAEEPRLWRYYKPRGLVTTHADPEGRPTVFDALPPDLGRVISVGRLDFNTEGLLLLTNNGALARHLELPATGWLRRYRVRAHGRVTQEQLDTLKEGVEIEGVRYGAVEATIDSVQGANVWLTVGIREGKNREVRKILGGFQLDVNRLIRVSYGPFQLLELKPGEVESVKRRVIADQLKPEVAREMGLVETAEDHRAKWKKKEKPEGKGKPKPGVAADAEAEQDAGNHVLDREPVADTAEPAAPEAAAAREGSLPTGSGGDGEGEA